MSSNLPCSCPSRALLTCKIINFPCKNCGFCRVALFAVELRLDCYFVALGLLLDVFGAQLRASWTPLGASWAALGANFALLARSWPLLGRSWPLLGRSWPLLGRSWDALGTLLGRSWSLLVALGRPRGPLGTFLARFRTSNTRFWILRSYVKRLLSNPSARLAARYLRNSCTISRKKNTQSF